MRKAHTDARATKFGWPVREHSIPPRVHGSRTALMRLARICSAALVVLMPLLTPPGAVAASSWEDYVNQLLSENKGAPANEYDLTAEQAQMLKNLDAEAAHIDTIVAMGLRNGRLSEDQGSHYRGELARLSDLRASAISDNQLTYPEAKQLVDLVKTLYGSLTQSYQAGTPSRAFADCIPYPLYEQDRERDRILNKLLEAKNSGLSLEKYDDERIQIDAFTARMDHMREKKGYLNLADREQLNDELKQLDTDVSNAVGTMGKTATGNM